MLPKIISLANFIIMMLLSIIIVNTQSTIDDDDLPINPNSDSDYVYAYDIINYLLCANPNISSSCKKTNYVYIRNNLIKHYLFLNLF